MSKRVVFLAAALIALGAAWEIASPWWTLKNMRDAARARDSAALAAYVDFPRVRSNLHGQLDRRAQDDLPAPVYQAFRRARFIDPIVDVIVSPKALRVALMVAPSGGAAKRSCGMKREGLGRFRVRCAQLPNGEAELIFEQRGLGWRLVGIDLAEDYGAMVL